MKILDLYSSFDNFCKFVCKTFQTDYSTAQDIVQDSFILAHKKYKKKDLTEAQLVALIRSIVRKVALKTIYKLSKDIKLNIQGETLSLRLDVDVLLSLCPSTYRRYLQEFYINDLTYTQLSKKYKKPISTIKSYIRRAKQAIKSRLQKNGFNVELYKREVADNG